MVRVYVIASFTTTKRQQKQRHSNTPCGGAQIEKQVGKTEENKSNTEANKETKQKKDKEEPGPRFSEDTVFIDVRGYEEAERDGYQLGTLIRPPDNACVLVERCPTPSRHNATTVMTSRSYNTFWFEPHTLLLRQYWQLWYTLVCVRCL